MSCFYILSGNNLQVESLVKRYDEKFKQAGEAQSRLLTDEAAFRDIQVRFLQDSPWCIVHGTSNAHLIKLLPIIRSGGWNFTMQY